MASIKRQRTPAVLDYYEKMRELERRAARANILYLAKWIIGRTWMDAAGQARTAHADPDAGWCEHHVGLSRELKELRDSRHERPYKTIYNLIWPRGTRKTTIVQSFIVQTLLLYPDSRFLIDSDNVENAWKMLAPIKQVFESEYFQELFGDLHDPRDWSSKTITVKRTATHKEPSVMCGGLNSEKTGMHFDFIISDDTQTRGNSNTPEQIAPVLNNFRLYESLLDKGGMIVSSGTRWNFKDLGQAIQDMAEEDMRHNRPKRIWSNVLSCYKREMLDSTPGNVKYGEPNEKHGLEFPGILDKDTLAFARASQGPFMFSCNYLCKPQSDETATFRKDWLRYHDKSYTDLVQMGCRFYVTSDAAGEGKFDGADFNVVTVLAITPMCDIYVVEYDRFHGTRNKFWESLKLAWKKSGAKLVGLEQVFQQNELASWLKTRASEERESVPWYRFKTSGKKKEHRIMALQPYVESGKFFIRQTHTVLEQEMLQFPRGEHDDVLDTVAYGEEFMIAPAAEQPREFWLREDWAEKIELQNKGLAPEDQKRIPTQADVMAMKAFHPQKRAGRILHLFRVR